MCQAYAGSHGIVFNCSKTLFLTFKYKLSKSTVIPLLILVGQNVKSVKQALQISGVALATELSDDKDIQRQLRYQYCAANKLRETFSQISDAVKNVLLVPSLSPCMHHNFGVITGSLACRDCMWTVIVDARLYTTCRGDRVLVAVRFNVTFPPLKPH